jgi:RimJ/RimL family protein N-acetyltransferase
MPPIRFVPMSREHLPDLRLLIEDPDVLRFTRIPDPPPAGFAETWLAGYESGRLDGTREGFAIVEDPGGELVGVAVAPTINRATRTVELGYVVTAAARGRGIATQALLELTAWAFAELDVLRIELMISSANLGSKRVAANCGYTYEGTLRSAHVKQDLREDTEIWSRLTTDPEPSWPRPPRSA